jgi:hypothetical protein
MKYSITILFLAICSFAHAQTTVLTTDPSLPIPKFSFDEKGRLKDHSVGDIVSERLRLFGRQMENA